MDSTPADAPVLSRDTYLVASDDVLSSPLGGEVVLLEPRAGVYYSLNEVGAVMWEQLQQPASLDAVCEAIVAEFEVDRSTCEPDVRRVLGELLRHNLAEVVPPPPPRTAAPPAP
jgi:hypothetical protein